MNSPFADRHTCDALGHHWVMQTQSGKWELYKLKGDQITFLTTGFIFCPFCGTKLNDH